MKPTVPLRRRLFLLAVAGILPIALMSGVGLSALFQQHTRLADQTALEVTRALAAAVDAELRLSVAALETFATAARLSELERFEGFDELAGRVLHSRSEWHQILLRDAQGRMVVGTGLSPEGPPAGMVEQESFDQLLKSPRPVVGHLAKGPKGVWGIPVRVPVFRDRQLRFVLTGVLKPDAIVEVMQRQGIPEGWVASIFDAKGLRVARSRLQSQWIGRPGSPSLQELMARTGGQEGQGETLSLEGDAVYTAYTRLRSFGWTVALGIPVSAIEAGARRSMIAYGGGVLASLAVAVLAAVLAARRINRPMDELRQAAHAVGRGEVPQVPDFDVHEIQAVGEALAASAHQRAEAEAERERLLVAERVARQAAENAPVRWELLARAGTALSGSLQPQATLEAIATTVVPRIADWCRVDLLDANGKLQRALTHHADPERARFGAELVKQLHAAPQSPGSMAWVIEHGKPYLARFDPPLSYDPQRDADLLSFAHAIGMRSYYIVPLTARGRTFGAMAAVQAESGRDFSDEDCALIAELGQRAALALDNARLYATAEAAMVQAETANRAKDEFLAMLGHELRNPLAPIVTALQLMERRGDTGSDFERRIIERQVAHMTRLVDDLLDVSRITQGKIELRRERLDLRAVLARAVELTQPLLDARKEPLAREVPGEPVMVSGDAVRLAQVFSNLLMNAAKFTPPDGHIALRLHVIEGQAEVRLSDTGVGMAADLLPHVFDLFVQGPQQLHRGPGGLGLGLAIVRTLVQLHGGTVRATSPGPGQGSTFIVRLPLAPAGAEAHDGPVERHTAAEGRARILIVDDNVDAALTTSLLLDELGFETRTANDGPSALELLDGFEAAMGLLDIGLPGMDGYELARRVRERRGDTVRLIAVTGYGTAADQARARESGFDALLVKPVDADLLLATIEKMLAGR